MTTYRGRAHFSVRERLVDAGIGIACGTGLAVALWLFGTWLRFR